MPLFFGKIALHLLFGWSLDKDQKSLDQSKQISREFGWIQTKAFPNPDHEKGKLLETLQYTIKEFNNGIMWSVKICMDGGAYKGLHGFVMALFVHIHLGSFSFQIVANRSGKWWKKGGVQKGGNANKIWGPF